MTEQVYIVEEVGAVVAKVDQALQAKSFPHRVYYMFGHPVEIANRLLELSNSVEDKNKKFPLVCLFTDVRVTRNQPEGKFGTASLHLIIVNITDQHYTAQQRLDNNFKPVLQPIKTELIKQLSRHKQFSFDQDSEFIEIERYYWGREGLHGNVNNMFNDFIDGIELPRLKVVIDKKICSPSNNLT